MCERCGGSVQHLSLQHHFPNGLCHHRGEMVSGGWPKMGRGTNGASHVQQIAKSEVCVSGQNFVGQLLMWGFLSGLFLPPGENRALPFWGGLQEKYFVTTSLSKKNLQ